jgi:hypothetical protein
MTSLTAENSNFYVDASSLVPLHSTIKITLGLDSYTKLHTIIEEAKLK